MGRITISAGTISDACKIIRQAAQMRQLITYTDVMNQLKAMGYGKINRATIGAIVGEVSNQVAQITSPSMYPSAIVIRKGTNQPGDGFWGLKRGTNPPSNVPRENRRHVINQYQQDVFSRNWNCDC